MKVAAYSMTFDLLCFAYKAATSFAAAGKNLLFF